VRAATVAGGIAQDARPLDHQDDLGRDRRTLQADARPAAAQSTATIQRLPNGSGRLVIEQDGGRDRWYCSGPQAHEAVAVAVERFRGGGELAEGSALIAMRPSPNSRARSGQEVLNVGVTLVVHGGPDDSRIIAVRPSNH
jgi:hypothetical protein